MSHHYFAVLGQGLYAAQLLELAVARYLVACRVYGPNLDIDALMREIRDLDKATLGQLRDRVQATAGGVEVFDQLEPLVQDRNTFMHHLLRTAPGRAFAGETQEQEVQRLVEMTRRFILAARSIGKTAEALMDLGRTGTSTGRDGGFALAGHAFSSALTKMPLLEWQPADLADA
jgi:hypothetical protein